MNGLQSMPASQYFAASGVSGSMLNILADECPAKLKAQIDAGPLEESDALEFGSLFHRYVLEPETLENAFYVKPEEMSFATKEGKAWKLAHADRPIVKEAEVRSVNGMVASLRRNADFMKVFRGGQSEQSLFVTDERGTLRKGRLDRFHATGNYILDLKSCECASRDKFSMAVLRYAYYRKAAWYLELARLCGYAKELFLFVAVEKEPPFISQIYELDQEDVALGLDENERLLSIYRAAMASGIWKDYGGGIQPIGIPEHKRTYLTQRLAA